MEIKKGKLHVCQISCGLTPKQYADVQGYTDRQRLVDVIESAMDRQVRAAVYDERLRCARVIAEALGRPIAEIRELVGR